MAKENTTMPRPLLKMNLSAIRALGLTTRNMESANKPTLKLVYTTVTGRTDRDMAKV